MVYFLAGKPTETTLINDNYKLQYPARKSAILDRIGKPREMYKTKTKNKKQTGSYSLAIKKYV